MNPNSLNFKLIIGTIHLFAIFILLYFVFSIIDVKDLMSYEFIRLNKDIILKYKSENFLLLTISFFIFSVIWVLLLGFTMPLVLFSGFVFGKWLGMLIVVISTTIGATFLYLLAGYFFRDMIEEKLLPKFFKLREFFKKNDIIYFMCFRFAGVTPYAVQNILPILFNMPLKNYVIATFLGNIPPMFISVALGSGIKDIIDINEELSFFTVLGSPEIYLPIFGFFIILIISLFIKKFYFKNME